MNRSTAAYQTIAQMARLYEISPRALRFYEERGFLNPKRVGNSRFYTATDCVRLELILKGKRLGFSLKEVEALLLDRINSSSERMRADVATKLTKEQILAKVESLETKRALFDGAITELKLLLEQQEKGHHKPSDFATQIMK